jgi:F-type H+-transporting ATPase subunit a
MLTLGNLFLAAGSLLDHVMPHDLKVVPLTNLQLMAIIAAVLVLLTFSFVASRVRTTNGGARLDDYVTKGRFAQFFETLCVFIREEVARPNLGPLTDKYIYYIWTVFFFILFCNILGMVPFGPLAQTIAAAGGAEHPTHFAHIIGGTATSTLSLNIPLALCSLIAIVFIGVKENGKHFFAHFAPVPFTPLPMLPIALMLVILEIMGLLIKCVVLAMRLFGTMLAGHLVLAALLGLIFSAAATSSLLGYGVGVGVLGAGAALSLLELFIAFLQAFIFTFLTVLFISAGAVHHEEHGHEAHVHGGPHEGGFEREHDRLEPGHMPNSTEEQALVHAVEKGATGKHKH